jgi:hypothetical protein
MWANPGKSVKSRHSQPAGEADPISVIVSLLPKTEDMTKCHFVMIEREERRTSMELLKLTLQLFSEGPVKEGAKQS